MYKKLSKCSLGFFPTPISELRRLSKVLGGPSILMKRDDLTGLAFGGNKTRKLEYFIGEAKKRGCNSLVTAGAIQSNHCRQTVAAAALCGMQCDLLLGGKPPEVVNGNLLLDQLLGAKIHWSGDSRKGEDLPLVSEKLKAEGLNPYIVPYGGSNELGALGFVDASVELCSQLGSEIDDVTHIVFASSSGGTHAGLMLGKRILNKKYEIVGINIDKDDADDITFSSRISQIANHAASLLDTKYSFNDDDVYLSESYLGEGYGIVGELEKYAIELVAKTEGILLDPVYTARAMGGLIEMIKSGQYRASDKILFWHTGGGPALFSYNTDLI